MSSAVAEKAAQCCAIRIWVGVSVFNALFLSVLWECYHNSYIAENWYFGLRYVWDSMGL